METKVTTKDLIGDLKNFPIEVVKKMLQKQKNQVNQIDISVFQDYRFTDKQNGGFSWEDTIEGYEFWEKVLRYEKFDVFFERYPKLSKNVYIHGNRDNGEEVIEELQRRGGINKYDYAGNADALYFIDPITNYITVAAKMEGALQNIIKTYYTEITPSKKMVELTVQEIAEKLGIDAELLRIKK